MIEAQATAAAFDNGKGWHDINWAKANRVVRRLQAHIVKAVQKNSMNCRFCRNTGLIEA